MNEVKNVRVRKSTIVLENNTKYKGEWLNNKKDGFGVLINAEGEVYDGNWANDQIEGFGKFVNKGGAVYEGEWRNNRQVILFSFFF